MQKKCTAIVLAAGKGKRMNSKIQKQFLEMGGYPVVYYSLKCFQESPLISEIILVTGEEEILYCKENIVEKYGFSKVKKIVPGGKERYDSVYEGLCACEDCDIVMIHDGARPFITEKILERGYQTVLEKDACVIGMPVKDTIKIAGEDGCVAFTPERSKVWQIQTPQIFAFQLIRKAYEEIREKKITGITDDAMAAETALGVKIALVEGSYENIKITTPEDLLIAEVFLKKN